jgi:hypothetical protein
MVCIELILINIDMSYREPEGINIFTNGCHFILD